MPLFFGCVAAAKLIANHPEEKARILDLEAGAVAAAPRPVLAGDRASSHCPCMSSAASFVSSQARIAPRLFLPREAVPP